MRSKFKCDGCDEDLREVIKKDAAYVLDDNLNGLSLMTHNNLKDSIILCECCFREFEEKLKEDQDWLSLEQMGNSEDFISFKKLKEFIENDK